MIVLPVLARLMYVLWHENLVMTVWCKMTFEDKVWKVGNNAMKIMGLVAYNVTWAEAYHRTKWNLDPYSHLATTDMGRTVGDCCTLWGKLGPYLTQCCLGRGLPPYLKWHLNPSSCLATMDMGRKLGAVPLLGGAGSPI